MSERYSIEGADKESSAVSSVGSVRADGAAKQQRGHLEALAERCAYDISKGFAELALLRELPQLPISFQVLSQVGRREYLENAPVRGVAVELPPAPSVEGEPRAPRRSVIMAGAPNPRVPHGRILAALERDGVVPQRIQETVERDTESESVPARFIRGAKALGLPTTIILRLLARRTAQTLLLRKASPSLLAFMQEEVARDPDITALSKELIEKVVQSPTHLTALLRRSIDDAIARGDNADQGYRSFLAEYLHELAGPLEVSAELIDDLHRASTSQRTLPLVYRKLFETAKQH